MHRYLFLRLGLWLFVLLLACCGGIHNLRALNRPIGNACFAADVKSGGTSSSSWKTYRNPSGEFEIKYPDNLHPSVPTGSYSANGVSHVLEEVELRSLDPQNGNPFDGKHKSVAMSFTIQRGINPQHLAIQQWYESLAHRPLKPSSETVTTVGGKTAIQRGPAQPGTTVVIKGGKEVSRSAGMVAVNTVYVPLNATDVLAISIPPSISAPLAEAYCNVLPSLRFMR